MGGTTIAESARSFPAPSGRKQKAQRILRDELVPQRPAELRSSETPQILIEVAKTRRQRQNLDPRLARASAQPLHASATGAIRVDRDIEAAERRREQERGEVVR